MSRRVSNRGGFTLAELLGAVAILVVVILIAVSTISGIKKKTLQKQYDNEIDYIETKAAKYAEDTGIIYVNVETLIKEGYLDPDDAEKIYSPKDGKSLNCYYVNINYQDGEYDGVFDANSEQVDENGDCIAVEVTEDIKLQKCDLNGSNCTDLDNKAWTKENIKIRAVDKDGNPLSEDATYNWFNNYGFSSSNEVIETNVADGTTSITSYNVSISHKSDSGQIIKSEARGTVRIDRQAPVINKIDMESRDKWTSEGKKVTLDMSDNSGSGIVGIFIGKTDECTDKLVYEKVAENQTKYIVNSGKTTGIQKVCVIDDVGNIGGSGTDGNPYEIMVEMIDTEPPTCDIKVTSGTQGENGWYKSNVTLEMTTNDTGGSGVDVYDLTTASRESYGKNTKANQNNTNGTVYYGYVRDAAGNTGKCSLTVKVDSVAPECSIKLSNGNKGNNGWYNGIVTFTLVGTDSGSKIANQGLSTSSTKVYNNSTIANSSTSVTYYGYVKDNAGNEKACSVSVNIDNVKPVFVSKTSDMTLSKAAVANFKDDGGSGINRIEYFVTSKPEVPSSSASWTTSTSYNANKCGMHYYTYARAIDNAGNISDVKNYIDVQYYPCPNYPISIGGIDPVRTNDNTPTYRNTSSTSKKSNCDVTCQMSKNSEEWWRIEHDYTITGEEKAAKQQVLVQANEELSKINSDCGSSGCYKENGAWFLSNGESLYSVNGSCSTTCQMNRNSEKWWDIQNNPGLTASEKKQLQKQYEDANVILANSNVSCISGCERTQSGAWVNNNGNLYGVSGDVKSGNNTSRTIYYDSSKPTTGGKTTSYSSGGVTVVTGVTSSCNASCAMKKNSEAWHNTTDPKTRADLHAANVALAGSNSACSSGCNYDSKTGTWSNSTTGNTLYQVSNGNKSGSNSSSNKTSSNTSSYVSTGNKSGSNSSSSKNSSSNSSSAASRAIISTVNKAASSGNSLVSSIAKSAISSVTNKSSSSSKSTSSSTSKSTSSSTSKSTSSSTSKSTSSSTSKSTSSSTSKSTSSSSKSTSSSTSKSTSSSSKSTSSSSKSTSSSSKSTSSSSKSTSSSSKSSSSSSKSSSSSSKSSSSSSKSSGGSKSCLIEGTKVLLANGEYKNIENVAYDDLLAVWSYDTGNVVYEYPVWIEKEHETEEYQKTIFSDGTVLKTVGYHGVFSPDYNKFISVDDSELFKVGTSITKVENGILKTVKVQSIEYVQEKVKYYHVVSSRYYNIIANNLLTTDGTVVLSNLYGFKENITWPIESFANKELYSYDELSDILPYYMFYGMRAEEGKYLQNYGLTKEMFKGYLLENQVNEDMLLPVETNNDGKRLWMVTTSLDKVKNKSTFKVEEGSVYTLPKDYAIECYVNSVDNKCYKPGEKVVINLGTHFVAKSKLNNLSFDKYKWNK